MITKVTTSPNGVITISNSNGFKQSYLGYPIRLALKTFSREIKVREIVNKG